jgi:hypothetical protein
VAHPPFPRQPSPLLPVVPAPDPRPLTPSTHVSPRPRGPSWRLR